MRIAVTALVGIVLAVAASFGVYAASQPSAKPATTSVVQYEPPAN
jgi:hypothetical protein